jgi:nucleoside-diphosphate-sugar epimerase
MDTLRRVLITGASGFVGAALTRDLLADGAEVHVLVREPASAWRLTGMPGAQVHQADLRDGPAVRAAVRAVRPQVVFHAAAHGTLPGQRDGRNVLSSNILGTANLLAALQGEPYERLVNLGSSSEYGHVDRPIGEEDSPKPRTDYGVSKAAATLLCQAQALQGRPVCTVRVFSPYGPGEDPVRIASVVMEACRRGVRPRVTTGWQPRDFIYIDDVVALLKTAAVHPAAVGQILHAGTGRRQTVRDLVEAILRVAGTGLTAEYGAVPAPPDEPRTWVASIARTQALTGWQPCVPLEAGVRRMWAWFRERPAA